MSQYCSHMDGFLAHAGYMPRMLIFLPFRNAAGRVQCVYFGSSSGAGLASIPFAELTEVLISAGRAMSSQTITIWGAVGRSAGRSSERNLGNYPLGGICRSGYINKAVSYQQVW